MKARTRARGVALQALYEIDMANHPVGVVLENRLEEGTLNDELQDFIRQIVAGVVPIREELDLVIAKYAPEWPLEQIATVDRNIMRIAVWEIAVIGDSPLKVIINEAVELAKLYSSDSAPRFINGVLGSLADHQNEVTQAIISHKKV
ncbi:MAG: transcription antitermination factor NusB [Chloroflexota bacterium]